MQVAAANTERGQRAKYLYDKKIASIKRYRYNRINCTKKILRSKR